MKNEDPRRYLTDLETIRHRARLDALKSRVVRGKDTASLRRRSAKKVT